MRYKIFNGETEINVIDASAEFVETYCQSMGYTFEEAPLPECPAPAPAPTPEERITALESATGKAIADSDAMNVDQEYRLTLLELGLNE